MRLMLLTLFVVCFVLPAQSASAQEANHPALVAFDVHRCLNCHGAKGEGGFGPDLAGRQLSLDQFKQAVRKPWGVMPAYSEQVLPDDVIATMHAYFSSAPKVAAPGPWQTPLPPGASPGLTLIAATVGCAQCHGAAFGGIRAAAGAVNADFEWFKGMAYDHVPAMTQYRQVVGDPAAPVRMPNYSRIRVPESTLQEIWRYVTDDLKLRARVQARLNPASQASTYSLVVRNAGAAGKGLTAEDLTISLALAPGTTVTNATGAGYQGVRRDEQAKADMAVWHLPRLAAAQAETYTITVGSGGGIARGQVRWTRPAQGTGNPDQANVAMPPAPQTR